jgi:hypothetical protein
MPTGGLEHVIKRALEEISSVFGGHLIPVHVLTRKEEVQMHTH